jgi:hypothetical protein
MSRQDFVIRASDIGQYTYCARAWWLGRVKGHRSANVAAMRQGTKRHRAHGRLVERYHLLRRVAMALIVLAAVALIAWLLLSLGR